MDNGSIYLYNMQCYKKTTQLCIGPHYTWRPTGLVSYVNFTFAIKMFVLALKLLSSVISTFNKSRRFSKNAKTFYNLPMHPDNFVRFGSVFEHYPGIRNT